jgi:hypothetical protein
VSRKSHDYWWRAWRYSEAFVEEQWENNAPPLPTGSFDHPVWTSPDWPPPPDIDLEVWRMKRGGYYNPEIVKIICRKYHRPWWHMQTWLEGNQVNLEIGPRGG